ncbi:hypothetical protein EDB92DRAFT_2107605 [Lactarius akahatsu]|uniref:C2H2-type domain-containing protein n=1 Tax=Lactarius akahatsu TaxID=416441 RepID=A0AAD4Q7Z7_9AGAM|nr:hypothetical protein EDB92DRAFT_2107605 [Lactarius akahatsu]
MGSCYRRPLENIVLALPLRPSNIREETVQPALHKICIRESEHHYVPLQEAVVSLIHSRSLSGQIIAVEYEQMCTNEHRGTGPFSQQVTIEMLPDDVILNIYRQFLYASPQSRPTLTHVCRRWRQILFTSPPGLDLRLYCSYGTPVLKNLGCWPALPVVVQYGGSPTFDPPTLEDEDNIVAALKYSDRVSSIGLTITSSLQAKFSAIEEPFSELEELVLLSRDTMELTPPQHLSLLSSSTGLVDLQLHEIPEVGYFSPDALLSALSGTTQLQTLSLHFLSFPRHRNYLSLPPQPGERVVLPALTCLKYRGTSKYLNNFVARIDAPRLGYIDITFFSQPTMDASELGRFIQRTEMQASLKQADVQTSISFTQPNFHSRLALRISCTQLDWKLSSLAQICDHFSLILSRVEDLGINVDELSSGPCDPEWLKVIHSSGGKMDSYYVDGKLVIDILCALRLTDGEHLSVFLALCTLRVSDIGPMHGSLSEAVVSFTTTRRHSSGCVQVYARERSCKICRASFATQEELKKHLVVWHAYRIVCPYCGDFEFTPRYSDLFLEHLASEHPAVPHRDTDTLITNSASQSSLSSYTGSHGTQQNDLHASVIFERFTEFKVISILDGSHTRLDAVHFLHSP